MLKTFLENIEFEVLIPLIVAAVSLAFNVWNNIREFNYKKKNLSEVKISERRREISIKLNEFYGPFQQNMKKSTTLYRALTSGRGDFRLLDHLLDPTVFSDQIFDINDDTLIEEIIQIGRDQQKLISEKGGLVDDEKLTRFYNDKSDEVFDSKRPDLHNIGLLPRANAHYRILELAYDKKLTGGAKRFENYRFPRQLSTEIDRRVAELSAELNKLRA